VSLTDEHEFQPISKLAKRWGVSEDKAASMVEPYRGRSGLLDLGFPAERDSKRKVTRKYAIVRIHPSLLKEIEADLSRKRVRPVKPARARPERETAEDPDQVA